MAPKALSKPTTKTKPKAKTAKKSAAKASPRKATASKPPRRKAPAHKTQGRKAPASKKTAPSPAGGRSRPAPTKGRAAPKIVPRALVNMDDDDDLIAHGGGGGAGFGRCGGRLLSSQLEQNLCNWLGMAGIVHSHSPRHYEVRYEAGRVAAYAPQIVLRGRGREGKSVVIEAVEDVSSPILPKVIAFRAQYGQEFYVIVVATDEVLEDLPLATHDESCSTTNVNTLISRLAE
jgi:hypothetical protein